MNLKFLIKFHNISCSGISLSCKDFESPSDPSLGSITYLYWVELDKSVGVDDTSMTRSRSITVVWFADEDEVPACVVWRIICLIKSSWFLETTPHSKQGNSESKYFLCGCEKVYCWVPGWIVAAARLVWGNCTWYCWSVAGEKGKRIWWEWNRCWRSVSVLLKMSLHDEHEYWICGMIVVTVCGAAWIDICDDVVGVWWTVDVSDGNGWSTKELNNHKSKTFLDG